MLFAIRECDSGKSPSEPCSVPTGRSSNRIFSWNRQRRGQGQVNFEQEETEVTETRAFLCCLCCLLFNRTRRMR